MVRADAGVLAVTDPEHTRVHATYQFLTYAVAVAAQVLSQDEPAREWAERHPEAFGRLVAKEATR